MNWLLVEVVVVKTVKKREEEPEEYERSALPGLGLGLGSLLRAKE